MQPVAPIETQPPVPSILTVARDRSADGFGTQADAPVDLPGPSDLPNTVTPSRASWRSGVSWEDISCQPASSWPWCPEGDAEKDLPVNGDGAVKAWPFMIYVPLSCDFRLDRDELERQARVTVEAKSAFRFARALWMGEGLPDSAEQPTLRRVATDISPGGSAVDLDDAVAVLLARYETATGGAGGATLHIPSVMLTGALGGVPGGSVVARLEGSVYRGPLGSVVSPGPGYPFGESTEGPDGFGPALDPEADPVEYQGTADDEVWVYVSGPVEYALADPFLPEEAVTAAELRRNVTEVLAERPAIVRFDPCPVFAARAITPVSLAAS